MGIVAALLTSEACVNYFWGRRRTGPLCSQRTARCTKALLILFRTRLTIPCEQIESQRIFYLSALPWQNAGREIWLVPRALPSIRADRRRGRLIPARLKTPSEMQIDKKHLFAR